MYEFAPAVKTLIRYSLIIIMLGLFSSCAERFTSRGETPNGFYSSNYPTEHSTSITQSRKLITRTLKRDTVRYAHKKLTASTALEKTVLTERAHTNTLKSSNSISPDILLGDSFGGSPITAEKSMTKVVKQNWEFKFFCNDVKYDFDFTLPKYEINMK